MEMPGQVAGAICLKSTQMIGHTKHTQKLMDVLAFVVMLTLNTAIQSTYKTMVMIRMYHPTKFDCKRIRNSVNIKQNIKKSYFDHNFMSPYILIIQACMMTLTLKLANQLFSWHSGSKWFFTIPSLVTNGSVVQKISPGWTFIEILNHCCNFAFKHSNLILLLATPTYHCVLQSYFIASHSNLSLCTIKPNLVTIYWSAI